MGLLDKVTTKQEDDALTLEELAFLLTKIKTMNFVGEELDVLTRTVVKLQNRYIKLGGQ